LSLRAAGVAAQAKIDELAGQLRTSSEAALGFFKILQEEDVPVEQLPTKLTLIAQGYVGMLERLAALDPEDADTQGYIDGAGKSYISQLRPKTTIGLMNCFPRQRRHKSGVYKEQKTSNVRPTKPSAACVAGRQRPAPSVANSASPGWTTFRSRSISSLPLAWVAGEDLNLKVGYLTRSADALTTHGDEKGDNPVLAKAIGIYRGVVRERTQERVPLD
jgi:hypothetical protein